MRRPPVHVGTLCCIGLGCIAVSQSAGAHSASDAYLTLSADASTPRKPSLIHGQWDIAIRDLDFVMKLDDDGNGQVTWGEMRKHRAAIEAYAYQYLKVDGEAGNACSINPTRQMIDDHADGAYAALFFDVKCTRKPQRLVVNYTLFFHIDPSHRGIFVMNNGGNAATALFSPDNANITLAL